jgi:hypothetical protein
MISFQFSIFMIGFQYVGLMLSLYMLREMIIFLKSDVTCQFLKQNIYFDVK